MALSTALSSVTFAGTLIASVGSFSFSNTRDTIDVSELASVPRVFIAGYTSATASCEIFYDQGQASHATLEVFISAGTSGTLVILSSTGMTYTATAFLTSFEITGSAGDVIRASCTFQITGSVTIA